MSWHEKKNITGPNPCTGPETKHGSGGDSHHGPSPVGGEAKAGRQDSGSWRGKDEPKRRCRLVLAGAGQRGRSDDSGQVRRPLLLDRKKSSSGVGLGGRFGEANNRHGGAEDSGEQQDEDGSARELGGVRIQARETFGSRFLPDRSKGSGDLGTWRPWRGTALVTHGRSRRASDEEQRERLENGGNRARRSRAWRIQTRTARTWRWRLPPCGSCTDVPERESNIERERQRYDRRRRTKGRRGTRPVLVASVVDDGIQGRHQLVRFEADWPGTEIEEGWVEGSDRSRGRGETSWRNQWVAALGGLDGLRLGLGVDLFK